ncbi:MAG: hypothetical protein JZU65_09085 [Chlorobium sp.]|nr:hypothetical protein [Chlorobium sp.]
MAPNSREMIGTIAGPFKIIERTNQKDSSKRILYRAECVCSAIELGPLSTLGKFQGHGCSCPGHPLKKGMEKPDSGFTYFPDQPEHADALAAWESARNPDQLKEESADDQSVELFTDEIATIPEVAPTTEVETATETVNTAEEVVTTSDATTTTETVDTDETTSAATLDATPMTPVVTQETPKAVANKDTSTKMSAVLATRLKLHGYHTTSTKLLRPVKILGQDAVSVVFAANSEGDKVLLHVALVSADGKKSILSSKKKAPEADWSALSAALTGMNITWREKEQTRGAVAK